MKIGIDCRLWKETGVGRHIRNLVKGLDSLDSKNEYVLFLLPKDMENTQIPARFKKVSVDVRWHTLKEQFVMPRIFLKEKLDVLHVPYFNIPLFYPKKLIITIHDLTPIKYPTPKASKLPLPLYGLKLLFYYLVLFFGTRKAKKILTVSESSKKDIAKTFKINPGKIIVAYNFNPIFKEKWPEKQRENYILYVGSAYPHKNLSRLVKAYELFSERYTLDSIKLPVLILVGKKDSFYQKLEKEVSEKIVSQIIFADFVTDKKLEEFYRKALFVIQPSLYEGFGFSLIESFIAGTIVICSDIPVFREIAKDSVLYFNPYDVKDIADKIFVGTTLSESKRKDFIIKNQKVLLEFNAKKEIGKTVEAYTAFNV
ncbi:MAG: glycosyltransferase family 1 protein [bacterium]